MSTPGLGGLSARLISKAKRLRSRVSSEVVEVSKRERESAVAGSRLARAEHALMRGVRICDGGGGWAANADARGVDAQP
jgi:hypothetical protein